ncbi:SDR family oxidoreductase [Longimicrobium sp.]|uniref:SDR family oxidoreductase n=1 Tax=Longimicrobium sp. TaxID=2029185 RepID=UPI002C12673E|nr:SDR family oxidoreductase [Longimicrobium sp.]HSU13817.1 SDR family oxidoreductase [Longimicrobium sp.]
MLLEGKVALVTGASRGIGAATARELAAHGAAVGVNWWRSEAAARDVVAAIEAAGGRALALGADVRDADAVRAMTDRLAAEFGGVDVVVNSALHNYRFDPVANPRFEAMEWSGFQDQIDGTVKAAVNTCQAALPHFRARGGGRVVNILTNLITNPVVAYHAYTTAKSAMLGFSRNLAAELGPENVTVNMIGGGLIMGTAASEPTTPEVQEIVRGATPLRRLGRPEDVGRAVVALASDLMAFATGQYIAIDGGLTMP